MAKTTTHSGGCLCGQLRYEATGDPDLAGLCLCADCRKASGSGYVPFMSFAAAAIRFTGTPRVHRLALADGRTAERNFCPDCGGLVFGGVIGESDSHTIYAGSLDDPAGFRPAMAIFMRERPDWVTLPDGLTVFDTMPGA